MCARWKRRAARHVAIVFQDVVLFSGGVLYYIRIGRPNAITTGVSQTAAQINAGVVARINRSTSAFVAVGYTANLGGKRQGTVMGNAGIRWTW